MSTQPKPERNKELVEMVRDGIPMPKIAEHFGISRQRVSQIALKYGVKGTARELIKQERRIRFTKWIEMGWTNKEIAAEEGLSVDYVSTLLNEFGFTMTLKKDIHGELQCYRNGCRCDECKEINLRSHAYLKSKPAPSHGLSGYTNYGCRCQICTKANSEANRKYKARKKAL